MVFSSTGVDEHERGFDVFAGRFGFAGEECDEFAATGGERMLREGGGCVVTDAGV